MSVPEKFIDRYFYHFTHIENLDSILSNGFLSTNEKNRLGINNNDVANGNIQGRRANMDVPIKPSGKIHDYIPFYFCSTNPMLLGVTNSKNIEQPFLIFFAISIDKVLEENVVFTDASANTVTPPNFYSDTDDLDKLHWETIDSKQWGSIDDEFRHKRMAEILVFR